MKKAKVSSNIWKMYLIRALRNFMLFIPIIVPFLQENGLTISDIFLLEAFFSIAMLFIEFPSGYFSDVFGRKNSIIIGEILAVVGFIIYAYSYGFWGFLFAEMILGVGCSFISGTDSAMLYDTLLSEQKEHQYKKVEGVGSGLKMFSESIASTVGGLLAIISLRLPFYCEIFIGLLGLFVALTLVEPEKKGGKDDEKMGMMELLKICLWEKEEVLWLIIHSAFVAASTLTMFWLTQPYLIETEVPLGLFGVIMMIYLLTASIFSLKAHIIENIFGRTNVLIALVILPSLGYFFLSSFWFIWSGLFILLFYVTRGINDPVMLDYINGQVPSDIRATVLSVKNLISRLMFSIVGPIAGWVTDSFSLKMAIIFSGVIFFVLGLISLFFLRKHKAL